ncbi:hypothetical protein BUALT_Bualt08G0083800 [Buddleja alternifolia]|uniref:Uncharacterized protein n=1 Tax=Buddleja alternifolia TaxID=168488 RepID=A0AAV6X455_9LAMI|nr:hypothetical protein BUALT_Bualt08G0083800 [Buddleja alternifolia]
MAKRKTPDKAPDREKKWDKVFNALVKLSKNMQNDRLLLEDRIKSLLEVIYTMKMEQKVESLKSDMMLGLKEREAFTYMHRYDNADSELADFREWFDYLSKKCSEPKDTSNDVSNKGGASRNKALQDEVRRLKSEIDKCQTEKNSEISALLAEKNFVWNQFKKMENDLNEKLRKKGDEVEHTNKKVQALVNRAEELQFSNERLRIDFAKVKSDSSQKSEEISRLVKEIEVLKSRSDSMTPLLRQCRADAAGSHRGGKNRTTDQTVVTVKKESYSSNNIEQIARTKQSAHKSTGGKAPRKQLNMKGSSSSSSKRKAVEIITIPDTPKLFTSSFKVPKLKPSLSPQII